MRDNDERELKRLAVNRGKESATSDLGYYSTIAGLSVRAGLHSEEELIETPPEVYIKVVKKAYQGYQKSLESYIKFYQTFQNEMAEPGKSPERNALFDLDYLMYLDIYGIEFKFVTTETFLIELGRKSIPGRVVDFNTLI